MNYWIIHNLFFLLPTAQTRMSEEAANQFNNTTSVIVHEYSAQNDLEITDEAVEALQQIALTQLSLL